VASNFGSEATWWIRTAYRTPIRHLAMIGLEEGSDELVWLASGTPGTDWVPGEYYAHHKISRANPQAYDVDLARQLWERSEEMVST
jgi:hypothetical protein